MIKTLLGFCLFLLLLPSCNSLTDRNSGQGKTLFTLLSSRATGIDFANKLEDGEEFNILTYRNFYNG
jgi:hypothetical protein